MAPDLLLEVREYRAEDAAAALALRNAVFPPIDAKHWTQSQTSAVAYLDGRLIGVIPFVVRDVEIAPGVAIRGAFANSVAVAEGYRDRGIGTRLMEAARGFLPRRAEAMFVYTGHEAAGPQYRFYRRTGHYDLAYPRCLRRTPPATAGGLPLGAVIQPAAAIQTRESELLDVYTQCYDACAGTPRRVPGFWQRALASHIFVEIPYQAFLLLTVSAQSRLHSYALLGLKQPELVVLECAAWPEAAADDLWRAVSVLAGEQGAAEVVLYGQHLNTPLYASARGAGFVPEPREDVLSGRVLAPEAVCALRWEAAAAAPDITLHVWTPERAVTLRQGGDTAAILRLEMKEETLHRLLLARVDLDAAVREERVTVHEGDRDLVRTVAAVLRPVPWVYHHLDYI